MKARLPKGYGGGGANNIQQLARQAQKIQDDMEAASAELEAKEYEAAAGGGAVKVTVTGKLEVVKVDIQPEVVDPEDVEMLSDLIMAAVNEAIRTAAKEKEEGIEQGKFTDLPDLILIDGGPHQLRFARQAILDLGMEPPAMFGLAEREEEIWQPGAEQPIRLDHRTPELQLVQRVRNEAHRFGIIHHRTLRGKASIHSRLEDIPGIGPQRRKELLKAFGSLKAIRAATEEELCAVKGMNRAAAEAVFAWARKQEK